MALRTVLSPLDAKLAEILARERGLTVDQLISNLLRAEAALKVVNTIPTAATLGQQEPASVSA